MYRQAGCQTDKLPDRQAAETCKRKSTSLSKHPRNSSHICPADCLADRSICQAYQLAESNNYTTPSKATAKQSNLEQRQEKYNKINQDHET